MKKSANAEIRNIKILVAIVAGALVIILFILPFLFQGQFDWDDLFRAAGLRNDSQVAVMKISAHYLDVGQGDSILIVSDDKTVLIDAGPRGNEDNIMRYLKNLNIHRLDYIIITHYDADHIGSMSGVLREVAADSIIMPYIAEENMPTTKVFQQLVDTISGLDATVLAAKPGDIYPLGNGLMTILGPVNTSRSMNDMSVVTEIRYGEVSFLFMGDAEKQSEADILREFPSLKTDVLKVGHHGSKSSTSEDFLRAVTPRIAVISCAAENRYGHPSAEVIKLLTDFGVAIYRTDLSGTIVIGSDGETLNIEYDQKEAA